jgi:hypothetical protein
VGNVCDNCPTNANPDQTDTDIDGQGDVCDADDDGDGVNDNVDNCPLTPNPDQADTDSDGLGNACDNCPANANPGQEDTDSDGHGNACDNCPNVANPSQVDADTDGLGDACDNCVNVANPVQEDIDNDGDGDLCDNCINVANPDQTDIDADEVGDACDNCVSTPNASQEDADTDGVGDVCDNCPADNNPGQEDADADIVGDVCDNCLLLSNPGQDDADNDGIGDVCDVVQTTIIQPIGGEKIGSGSTFPVLINAPLGTGHFKLEVSMNNGSTWNLVAANVPSDGVTTLYNWNVPVVNKEKPKALFRAQGFTDGNTPLSTDVSDATFSIDVVQLMTPTGNELLVSDNIHTIEWVTYQTKSTVNKVVLSMSKDGGTTWTKVASRRRDRGRFNWIVPTMDTPTTNIKLRIELLDANGKLLGSSVTPAPFTILPPP